jgi:methyl-accepting chemotaxis protein
MKFQFRYLTDKSVSEVAKDIKADLDADLSTVVALTDAFKIYKDFSKDEWQDIVHKMYANVFNGNKNVYALWSSWELNMIDTSWELPYGRISHTFWRENNMVKEQRELRSLDGDSPLYLKTKNTLVPSIEEPYFDVVSQGTRESLLMTSLAAPVLDNGKFIAVVAFDITLLQFQKLVEKISPFTGSYAFLISNGGLITGHPEKEMLNKNINEVFPEDSKNNNIVQNVSEGKKFSYRSFNDEGKEVYVSYAPIFIGETTTPWSIAISVPVETIMAEANRYFRISLFIGIAGIFLLAFIINLVSKNITSGLRKGVGFAKQIADGDLTATFDIKQNDEVGDLAFALNQMVFKLREIVESVDVSAENVSSASLEMSSNSQQLSFGANTQASSAEQVSASMQEMSSNIQQNASNAQQTGKISMKAAE